MYIFSKIETYTFYPLIKMRGYYAVHDIRPEIGKYLGEVCIQKDITSLMQFLYAPMINDEVPLRQRTGKINFMEVEYDDITIETRYKIGLIPIREVHGKATVVGYLNGEYEDRKATYTFEDGCLHREEGPAVQFKNGAQKFYIHGYLTKSIDPGLTTFYIPEKDVDGACVLHREDGPAWIKRTENMLIQRWYFNGKITKEESVRYRSYRLIWFTITVFLISLFIVGIGGYALRCI